MSMKILELFLQQLLTTSLGTRDNLPVTYFSHRVKTNTYPQKIHFALPTLSELLRIGFYNAERQMLE